MRERKIDDEEKRIDEQIAALKKKKIEIAAKKQENEKKERERLSFLFGSLMLDMMREISEAEGRDIFDKLINCAKKAGDKKLLEKKRDELLEEKVTIGVEEKGEAPLEKKKRGRRPRPEMEVGEEVKEKGKRGRKKRV